MWEVALKKYVVTIEETISDVFEVTANDIKEAVAKGIEKYNACEFVLSPRNVQRKSIQVSSENQNEKTDFEEF